MRNAIFWGSLPFVLPQALYVRATAPRFSAASGPREGAIGSGASQTLVAIGDSIIEGVGARDLSRALVGQTARGLAELLDCRIEWTARGAIGADASRVLHRLVPTLPTIEADFMIVSVGVNDVTSLSRVSVWTRSLDELLAALTEHSPRAVLAVAGLPPLGGFPLLPTPMRDLLGMRAGVFDAVARRVIARHPRAVHVPLDFDPQPERFSADGYHPSEDGYHEFGETAARILVEKQRTLSQVRRTA